MSTNNSKLLTELQKELTRVVELSNKFGIENKPIESINIAHYADGLRYAINTIKRETNAESSSSL